jgi:hypothetical protein
MKILSGLTFIILICTLIIMGVPAQTPDAATAAGQITVTSTTLDPEVFIEGDTGTITFEVTNNGMESVAIRRATLYDNDIVVPFNPYDASVTIGAGNKMKFTYTVIADAPEGIYYPAFSLNFRDAGSLRYPVKVQVENAKLAVSILEKPDTFSAGKKSIIRLLIGNPRDNTVNGITVLPSGEGLLVTPTSYFLGDLWPDKSTVVPFTITPNQATNLTFLVSYKNGINSHSTTLNIPIELSDSKKQARPVISNIQESTDAGGVIRITGDVTNAGLEPAKAIIITSASPAVPVDPYKSYVVGGLEPDDFSSFEITFTADKMDSIPVLVSYRDTDGNLYTERSNVEITNKTAAKPLEGPLPLPIIALIAGIAVVIGGIIWYSWRKR